MKASDPLIVWARDSTQTPTATLIIVPHAGAGAGMFVPWARWVDPGIRVGIVRLPGRESRWREDPITSMNDLLPVLTQSVTTAVKGDVALFGHCTGATIAFELAHRLSSVSATTPIILFPSGSRPPHILKEAAPLSTLSRDDLVDELRRLGGTPDAVLQNDALLELVLPAVRADFAIQESYRYHPHAPLECPITVFCGARDAATELREVSEWRTHTASEFEVVSFPSDHFFIWQHQEAVMGRICQRILQVASRPIPQPD